MLTRSTVPQNTRGKKRQQIQLRNVLAVLPVDGALRSMGQPLRKQHAVDKLLHNRARGLEMDAGGG